MAGAWSFRLPFFNKPDFKEQLTEACEKALADRLKAPATYKRVSVSEMVQEDATIDQCMGWDVPELKERDERLAKKSKIYASSVELGLRICKEWPQVYSYLLLTYEANNSFGVPIRNRVVCSIVTTDAGEVGAYAEDSVRINGYTNRDWSWSQLGR